MKQTVFITKYCLSSSIFKVEGLIRERLARDARLYKKNVFVSANLPGQGTQNFYENDFHFSEEEALADFEKRKAKKIESLKNQLTKLENKKPKIA